MGSTSMSTPVIFDSRFVDEQGRVNRVVRAMPPGQVNMQSSGAGDRVDDREPTPPDLVCILNDTLGPATHAKVGVSVEASVCNLDNNRNEPAYVEYRDDSLDPSGEFEDDEHLVPGRVWCHSETTTYPAGTFGVARWIGGRYWFFGDCEPMLTRQVPEDALLPDDEE